MNEESDIIVGLDIGTTKIACVVCRKNQDGKVEVLGYGRAESTGVKRGVVSNIEETVNSISRAVKMASDSSNVDISVVNVGFAGQHIKSIQHRGAMVRNDANVSITRSELEKLKQDMYKINVQPGEQILDVIPQEYIIDGEPGIKNPKGMLGNTIEANYHIIIGQYAAIRNIEKCVEQAGLQISNLILEPIASAEAVLDNTEKEAGVALIDIGGGTTDIAIIRDCVIYHTAVIPFGGNVITDDICSGCNIIRRHAEDIKVKYGSALQVENSDDEVVSIPGIRGRAPRQISFRCLSGIIQARLEEIFELVNNEVQMVNEKHQLIAGIVLTGGGALMKHIGQLAAFKTSMEVRIGQPNEHLAPGAPEELSSPIYATAIGLAIQGINRSESEKKQQLSSEVIESLDKSKKTVDSPRKKNKDYGKIITQIFRSVINGDLPDSAE